MEPLTWEKVAPGIWKTSIGKKEITPLDYAGAPKTEAITELGDPGFPLVKESIRGALSPMRVTVRIPLDDMEKIYGLGLEFEGINRRGNVYHLKVDHYGGVKGFTHAPVPFYISSKGYGVLFNTARRPSVYAGIGNRKDGRIPEPVDRTTDAKNWKARPLSDAVEVTVQGEGLEIYLFSGKNPLEVVQRYNLYCGGGVLPPKWGLGFWHRMHTQSSDEDVLKEIEEFKKNDFPLDVIGLEPGWQSFAYPCSFDWDSGRFPDPAGFVGKLKDQGIMVNLWENPYVAPSSSMFKDIQPYTGSYTVWLGEVPDLTIPAAQKVMLMDRFHELNRRTYGLVRSSNAGASHLGFVIYSDYYDHKGYVTALANCSLAGVLWTPEIRSAHSSEEWLRRFQSVCFSPMMQLNAWSSGMKPWSFPKVTEQVRDVINLRTRLLPYLHTAFYEYNQQGIPPFRAMVLESGYNVSKKEIEGVLHDADNPYAESMRMEVSDQYMMGNSILVAPVFTGETERSVVLPKGNWYDFYTGKLVGNGETITIDTPLDRIPLFVKDGGIIPMMPAFNKLSSSRDSIPLEIRHYGQRSGEYYLYDDDGETFDFEKGEFCLIKLEVKEKNGKLTGKVLKPAGSWKSPFDKANWVFMSKIWAF